MCRAQGIAHQRVGSLGELSPALQSAWALHRHSVVEVVTGRDSNVDQHRQLQAAVQQGVRHAMRLLTILTSSEPRNCDTCCLCDWQRSAAMSFKRTICMPVLTDALYAKIAKIADVNAVLQWPHGKQQAISQQYQEHQQRIRLSISYLFSMQALLRSPHFLGLRLYPLLLGRGILCLCKSP